ncbi:MAG: OsmC family protein [Acidobacteriota bacterium]
MATIEITYQDQSCCEAVHAASGQRLRAALQTVETADAGTFSPTDLLAAAFGISLAIRLAEAAASEVLDLKGMKIKVTKEMTGGPRRRIGRLSAVVEMPQQLTSGMKAAFERAARTCPVKENLSADIETKVRFLFT